MAGYDKKVYNEVCACSGHDIRTQQTEAFWGESLNVMIPGFATFCTKCGMALEDVRVRGNVRSMRKDKGVSDVPTQE